MQHHQQQIVLQFRPIVLLVRRRLSILARVKRGLPQVPLPAQVRPPANPAPWPLSGDVLLPPPPTAVPTALSLLSFDFAPQNGGRDDGGRAGQVGGGVDFRRPRGDHLRHQDRSEDEGGRRPVCRLQGSTARQDGLDAGRKRRAGKLLRPRQALLLRRRG